MEFCGWMSYTTPQKISFVDSQVTQLIGQNGAGKSTIATVLEETCYNKNSRGIKKDELFSWNAPKEMWSTVIFKKGDDLYSIHKVVKSTAKVSLTKNGEDIGGHTATQTYKVIESVIGCDFTTFSKLVYQSIKSNLDFLTATDANRKKFLIGLFDQNIYKDTEEVLKSSKKEIKSKFDNLTGQLSSTKRILESAKKVPDFMELVEVPEFDLDSINDTVREKLVSLALVEKNKSAIAKLNSLQKNLERAETELSLFDNYSALSPKTEEIQEVTRQITTLTADMATIKRQYKSLKAEAEQTVCPTCGTHLDKSEAEATMKRAKAEYDPKFTEKVVLENLLKEYKDEDKHYKEYVAAKLKVESAKKAYLDYSEEAVEISSVDSSGLTAEVEQLKALARDYQAQIDKAISFNNSAEVNNAKREALLSQLAGKEEELKQITEELEELEAKVSDLDILIAAFGSKGIVSYKLEACVKSFEDLINKYLSVITAGKFALGFELDATKLQVVIYNDGYRASMEGCSSGQQSRISIATLLAIRSLMSAISKVNINLLFLDEVISVIDTEGINTLVEMLLEEHSLNSIIVSHGYSHPLTAAIEVKQVNGNSELYSAK